MKNIAKIFLAAAGIVLFNSCESDDSAANTTAVDVTESVLSLTRTDSGPVLEDGGSVSLAVNLSQPLPYDLEVSLGFESSDGAINTNNIVEITVNNNNELVIPAGQTMGTFNVGFVNDDLADVIETYSFNVANATAVGDWNQSYSIVPSGENVSVTVTDAEPTVVVSAPGSVDFELIMGPSADLDFYIVDNDFSLVTNAGATYASPEMASVDSSVFTEGLIFGILLDDFGNDYPNPYQFSITFPSGEVVSFVDEITAANDFSERFSIIRNTLPDGNDEFLIIN